MDNKEHPFVKEFNVLSIPVFKDEIIEEKNVTDTDTGKEANIIQESVDQSKISGGQDYKEVSLNQGEISGNRDAIGVPLHQREIKGIKDALEVSLDQREIKGIKDALEVSLDQREIKGIKDALEVSLDQQDTKGIKDTVELLLGQGEIRGDQDSVGVSLDQGAIKGIKNGVKVSLDQWESKGNRDAVELSLDQGEIRGVQDLVGVSLAQGAIKGIKDAVEESLDLGEIRVQTDSVGVSLDQGEIKGNRDARDTLVFKDEPLKQDAYKFSDFSEVNDLKVLYQAEPSYNYVALDKQGGSSTGESSQTIFMEKDNDSEDKDMTIMNLEIDSDTEPEMKVIYKDVTTKVKYLEEQRSLEDASKESIEDQATEKHRKKGESDDAQEQKVQERQLNAEVTEDNLAFRHYGKVDNVVEEEVVEEEVVEEEVVEEEVVEEKVVDKLSEKHNLALESAQVEEDMDKDVKTTEFQLKDELMPDKTESEVYVKEINPMEEPTGMNNVMKIGVEEELAKDCSTLGENGGEEVLVNCNVAEDDECIETIDTEVTLEEDTNAAEDSPEGIPSTAEGIPSTEEEKEEEWMDILGSGQLRKKVLRHGENDYRPSRSQICKINMEGRLADGTLIERHEGYKIPIGEGEVVQGIDFAVPLMNVGELALLEVGPRFGYGSQGLLPHVPPDSNILYTLELLSAEEEPEIEQMPVTERKAVGHRKRERGNWWYMRQDHTMAIQCYRRALDFLDDAEESIPQTKNEDESKDSEVHLHEMLEDRLKVYNNLAAAQMKIKAYDTALQSIENVLRCQPQNVKALYRKGKILAAKGDYTSAVEALRVAAKLEPDSKLIRQELLKLLILHKEGAQLEKNLYKKMFRQNKPPEMMNASTNKVPVPWVVVLGTVGAVLAGVMAYRYRYI